MFEKGVAIVYASGKAAETALKIKQALAKANIKTSIYAVEKYALEGVNPIKGGLKEFIGEIFGEFDAVVAVMATGITVRAIAPHLKSKLLDPAVVNVDAAGRFAISLVSGHYRGANHLTKIIASGIGATPVITTASEVLGKKSVEELARELHCKIVNPESLVKVNSVLVNGGKIALIFHGKAWREPLENFGYWVKFVENLGQAREVLTDFNAGIIVTKAETLPLIFQKPVTFLKPKTIVVGIGARKNVTREGVLNAINRALELTGVPLGFVEKLATVDIKRDSVGIVEAGERLGLKIHFLSVDAIRALSHEDLSPDSVMVKAKIGVGGVCERVALLAVGGKARLILKKTRVNGVTIAVAEGE